MKTTKPFLSGSIALLLLLTSIFIYSCRKDILPNGTTAPADVDLNKVKAWYQGKYPISGKQTNDAGANGRADISQIIQPDWDAADVYRRGDDDVIELPAETGDYLIGLNNSDGKSYNPKYSHSSFVLLKNGEEVNAYVMTVIADSSYINGDPTKLQKNKYNHRDNNFSGLVIYSTPKGEFVSGWIYEHGNLLRKMNRQKKVDQNSTGSKKKVQTVKNNLVESCTTYDVYQVWCEWGGTPENPYEIFKGCTQDYVRSYTECIMIDQGDVTITNPGSGSGGSGSGSGGSVGTSPDPSPCVPVNVSTTKGGQKVNLVRPPDDGFPNPTDPAPCPSTPTVPDKPIKNYGMDQDCLNCRIPSANFLEFLKYLQGLGYQIKIAHHEKNFPVNGVNYDGMVTEVYAENGDYVLCYFTPDTTSGLLQAGIQYSVGYAPLDNTNNGNNNIDYGPGLPVMPTFNTSQPIGYNPNSGVVIGFLPYGSINSNTIATSPASNETYTDPATKVTLKYADVENAFLNSPALAQIEAGEEVTLWPSPSIIIGPIGKTQTFYIEYEILKLNNPGWSTHKLAAVAFWNTFSGQVHFMLDVAGMFPLFGEGADIINAGIYYLEGDKINCAYSAAAAMPVAGWLATGGKWVKIAVTTVPIAKSIGKNGYRAIKVGRELKLIKVAISTLNHASLKTLKAIKPADATLTNLNAYLINTFGLRISPTSTTLKNAINDIIKYGDQTGTKMEKLADDIFATNGYQKFNSKIGSNNGFDAVYIKGDLSNPTEIIINEAKQMSTVGTIKLNAKSGNKAAQMSNEWINQTIQQMRINADPSIANLGDVLNKNSSKIVKTVSAVDKSTAEIVILKLLGY